MFFRVRQQSAQQKDKSAYTLSFKLMQNIQMNSDIASMNSDNESALPWTNWNQCL